MNTIAATHLKKAIICIVFSRRYSFSACQNKWCDESEEIRGDGG
jgi:hypothetical protein